MASETRPQKRRKILLSEESSNSESSQVEGEFTVNEEFARRFEHNKKREELHRLEEKFGKDQVYRRKDINGTQEGDDHNSETDSDSESESEDDEGILASGPLDAQFNATLEAIRAKDPRVYDEKITFYENMDEELGDDVVIKKPSPKPMYLSDYHRRNLLEGLNGGEEEAEQPATYAQQQEELRSTIVQEIHATVDKSSADKAAVQDGNLSEGSDDDFLVRKPSKTDQSLIKSPLQKIQLNVETADEDPDTYLSKFLAARAWVPSAESRFQPLESDDEEDDQRAEAFEEAYNLRFENPEGANEKLMSHARDAAAKYSVRKETLNSRKKARDAERAKRDLEKHERQEEKARLRKLQVAEAEEKVRKIKNAAGLRGKALKAEDWSTFLDEGWDDARWEAEMNKRFGDDYYQDHESEQETETNDGTRPKLKKPKWEDDIDIDDLVPDFKAQEVDKPDFAFSDDDAGRSIPSGEDQRIGNREGDLACTNPPDKGKHAEVKRERKEQKKEARKERRVIENLVDERLKAEDTIAGVGRRKTGHFRYRETSPSTFGLTAKDILMASDSQLNQYAGLKRLAPFRDSDKKRKDKKRLGKKARLRTWRKETFGSEQGPQKSFADMITGQNMTGQIDSKPNEVHSSHVEDGKKKRKRSKKGQSLEI